MLMADFTTDIWGVTQQAKGTNLHGGKEVRLGCNDSSYLWFIVLLLLLLFSLGDARNVNIVL